MSGWLRASEGSKLWSARQVKRSSADAESLPVHRRRSSPDQHSREHVLLQQHEQANERREREAVKEYITQDSPFVPEIARRRARDDDALGVDHLSHHAPRAVRRRHQDRTQAESLRGDLL